MRKVSLLAALLVALIAGGGSYSAEKRTLPLLGADWIRYDEQPPYCGGPPIIVHYHEPGIRTRLQAQLAAMRAAGMRALRLFVYHASDVRDQSNWLVSSAGGRLAEPYRTNLAEFLDDVRAAGFTSMTVTFNPWFENDPVGYTRAPFDPSLVDENWRFITDIRPIVKEHGPATTWIDLINEGAPDDWQPQLRDYVSELWRRYADAFGTSDVVVSTIVKSDEGGTTSRLTNLIDLFRQAGRGMPAAFQIHPSWSETGALRDLNSADAVLTQAHLSQPLLIGEEMYNSAGAARGIATFIRASQRPVLEILEWPLASAKPPGGTWSVCPRSPYRIAAYARALGLKPFTLAARVSTATLKSAGIRVTTALGAGSYTVFVNDDSGKDGFRLASGRQVHRTGRRFRGIVRWKLRLVEGTPLIYGSLRQGTRRSVLVLGDGYSH